MNNLKALDLGRDIEQFLCRYNIMGGRYTVMDADIWWIHAYFYADSMVNAGIEPREEISPVLIRKKKVRV